jgi:DNA-binding transcriptional regulator/RsmH inhibitor MraZ
MSQTSNLIERENRFHAYTGTYESKGMDNKRRVTLPKDIADIIDSRRNIFNIKTVLFCFESCEESKNYLSIWDYLQAKELAHLGRKLKRDDRNRITIPNIFKIGELKRDLIWIGKGDHFELHYKDNS